MRKISDFLERFAQISRESEEVKLLIIGYIQEAGIPLQGVQKITTQKNIITVAMSPIQKSELFLKQGKLLALLKKDPRTAHITLVR